MTAKHAKQPIPAATIPLIQPPAMQQDPAWASVMSARKEDRPQAREKPVCDHRLSRGFLVAQHAHALRRRPDEANARLGSHLRKRVVFREKTDTGV